MNDKIPHYIKQSFPQLEDAHFLRRFASPVPLIPDTTFDIYANNSKEYFVLVTTDYIDVEGQRDELLEISGSNGFKVLAIVKPYNAVGDILDLAGIDENISDWFVKNKENGTYPSYCYLAIIESKI